MDTPSKEDKQTLEDLESPSASSTTVVESPAKTTDATSEGAAADTSEPATDTGVDTARPAPLASVAPRRNNTTIVAIVMAIVVLLGLGGIAAMTYLKTQDSVKQESSNTDQQTANEAAKPTAVTADELNKTATDIDTSLKDLDDTEDFNAEGLNDTTLGIQ